jgi:hypothetical protein
LVIAALVAASSAAAVAQDAPQGAPADVEVELRSNLRFFAAEIPADAEPKPVEGLCGMRFDVRRDGRVDRETIVADCTDDRYIRPAKEIVESWTFEPLVVDGEALPQSGVTASVRFRSPG